MSFAKNVAKGIGKNISKNVSGKYSKKHLNQTKQSATYALKDTSKRAIQKPAKGSGYLIGNKIANKITWIGREVITRAASKIHEKSIEVPKKQYTLPEKRQ